MITSNYGDLCSELEVSKANASALQCERDSLARELKEMRAEAERNAELKALLEQERAHRTQLEVSYNKYMFVHYLFQ